MKAISYWLAVLALEFVAISLSYSADRRYKLTLIDAEMWGPVDINDKGHVLIERQLIEFGKPGTACD